MSTAAQTGGERRMSRQGSARVRRVGGLGAVRVASPAGHRQRSTGRAPAPAPPLQASSSAPRPRTPSADADADLDLASRSCAAHAPQHADEASSKFHERAESTSASAPALPFPPPPPSQPPPPLPVLPPPMETAADLQLANPSAAVPIRLPSSSLLAPPSEPSPLYSPKKGASPEFSSERLAQTAVHPEGALAFAPKAPEGIVHPEGSDRIVIPYGADVPSSVTTPTSRPATPLSTGVCAPRVAEGGEDHMAAVRTIADGIHRTHRYRSGHVRRRRGDTYVWSSTHDSSCITCPGGLLENGPPCAVFVWPRPPSTGMRARRALADAARWALAALRVLALLHLWPAEEGLALVEVSPCAPQLPLPRRLHRVRPRPPYRVIEPNWDAAHDDEPRAAAAAADAAMDGSGAARPAFRDVDKTLALEAQ